MQSQTGANQSQSSVFDHEDLHWYVARTRPNHEKRVAEQLDHREMAHLLPLFNSIRQWKDRKVRLAMPLFPGYVFVRISLRERVRVLEVPGVAGLVGFGTRPAPLADEEIRSIQCCVNHESGIEPHPYLCVGRRARVRSGPLQGVEGIIVRLKNRTRLVLSLHRIQCSATLDVAQIELEPIDWWAQTSGVGNDSSKDAIVVPSISRFVPESEAVR
jgi:transcription antitermination factor NusG